MIRHHRLLEQYLAETLGLPIDEVHDEADRLEHVLSDELERRIDEALGFPTHDPHGDPIPDAELNVDARDARARWPRSSRARRRRSAAFPSDDAEVLRYLATLALVPGGRVKMGRCEPFGGPLTVTVAGADHAISRELAGQIGVG